MLWCGENKKRKKSKKNDYKRKFFGNSRLFGRRALPNSAPPLPLDTSAKPLHRDCCELQAMLYRAFAKRVWVTTTILEFGL